MAEMMKITVITPEREFYSGEASMVEFTTTEGNIGIYKEHIPLTAIVAPGILTIHEAEGKREAALIAGFAEILPEQVTILAEVEEWPEEIDYGRAEESKNRAERRLKERSAEIDVARAEAALKRALVRLDTRK